MDYKDYVDPIAIMQVIGSVFNNTSILGSGNIAIDANIQAVDTQETLDDVNTNTYVKYAVQTLTDAQKAQVRKNIGVQNGKEPYTITGSAISFVKTNPIFSKYSS